MWYSYLPYHELLIDGRFPVLQGCSICYGVESVRKVTANEWPAVLDGVTNSHHLVMTAALSTFRKRPSNLEWTRRQPRSALGCQEGFVNRRTNGWSGIASEYSSSVCG